ncbi:HAD-IIIC family phosphatase [Paenibacillus sp. FSL H3-0457]|uniref:HAD-IIIC family phosphatase n=1 Tax=Paenibacillus sp. FSL H3-0457 TaxID=2921430 RepID=UPI0030EB1A29
MSEKQYAINKANVEDIIPLTQMQEGLLFQSLINPEKNLYYEQVGFKISGIINVEIFKKAWNFVVASNEMLRAIFRWENISIPVQIILKEAEIDINTFELVHFSKEEDIQQKIEKIVIEDRKKGINFNYHPFHITLCEYKKDKALMIISSHHVLYDGWSNSILIREFLDIYEKFLQGENVEVPLKKNKYKEYIRWLSNRDRSSEKKYWSYYLRDLKKIDLPFIENNQKIGLTEEKAYRQTLNTELFSKINEFTKMNNVTSATVFYLAWSLLLEYSNRQGDIVFGTVVSGRPPEISEIDKIVGLFINTVPLRVKINYKDSVDVLLTQLEKNISERAEYENTSIPEIKDFIKYNKSTNLFDSVVVVQNYPLFDNNLSSLSTCLEFIYEKTNFDLTIQIENYGETSVNFLYNSELFNVYRIKQIMNKYIKTLELLISNERMSIEELFSCIKNTTEVIEDNLEEKLNVIISSTFTSELIEPYMSWWLNHFNESVQISFTSYDQVIQNLLDSESELSKNRDVNLLFIRFEDWIRHHIHDEFQCREILYTMFQQVLDIMQTKELKSTYFVGIFPLSINTSDSIQRILKEIYKEWVDQLSKIDGINIIDYREIEQIYDISEVEDTLQDSMAHIPYTEVFFAAAGALTSRKLVAWRKQKFKVIVVDCDNTLWNGICGEDGIHGLKIDTSYQYLQSFLLRKKNEGMLLAICSKNNEEDVWEIFNSHPEMILRKEDFVSSRINWEAKSTNIKDISLELNLSTDSFIFLDDSLTECYEVMQNSPEVLTLQIPEESTLIPEFLKHVWAFDQFKVTKEDQQRTEMYLAEKKRKNVLTSVNSMDVEGFLKQLQLKLSLRIMDPNDLSRVSQLTYRTNQFNLNSIKRTENDISILIADPFVKCWIIEVGDKFGEYGLTGAIIVRENEEKLEFISFMLSCRVLAKGIEVATLSCLKDYYAEKGITEFQAQYVVTNKNKPFLDFLEKNNWRKINTTSEWIDYQISVEQITLIDYVDCYINESYEKYYNNKLVTHNTIFDHLGIAVQDINQSIKFYSELGYNISNVIEDPIQNVKLALCQREDLGTIELVAPIDKESPIISLLEINGNTPYHICIKVEDIKHFQENLKNNDFDFEVISEAKPAVIFNGKKVAFISIYEVGVIELLEDPVSIHTQKILHPNKKDIINYLVNDLDISSRFFELIGYTREVSHDKGQNVISLNRIDTGRIELSSPMNNHSHDYKALIKRGPHPYKLLIETDKRIESGENHYKDEYLNNKHDYLIHYLNEDKELNRKKNNFTINVINKENLVHKNYLTPLMNYSEEQLLQLTLSENHNTTIIKNVYEAAETEIEHKLIDVWKEVLAVSQIGVNDNFFELGGHSLKATALISKVHVVFKIRLTYRDIFMCQTVKDQAKCIRNKKYVNYSNIEIIEKRNYYPLSYAQRRLFVLNQLDKKSTNYNMTGRLIIEGELDLKKLEIAFQRLVNRHDVLRTAFSIIDGVPMQHIFDDINFTINYLNIPTGSVDIKKIDTLIEELIEPFDLFHAPLFRVHLIKISIGKHMLVYDLHHIIADGFTMKILTQDFFDLYTGKSLPNLRVQYKDYSMWQINNMSSQYLIMQEEYWLDMFSKPVTDLRLPFDYPKSSNPSFKGDIYHKTIDENLFESVTDFALKNECTLYMILLSAFNVLLYKYTGEVDITIGSPVAGRNHNDLERTAGMFVNMLSMRNYLNEDLSIKQFVRELKENSLKAFENQDFPFDLLVERLNLKRDLNANPLFDVVFTFQNANIDKIECEDLILSYEDIQFDTSKFFLTLFVQQKNEQLFLSIEYSTMLFEKEMIENMMNNYIKIIKMMVENDSISLKEISIVDEGMEERLELQQINLKEKISINFDF